MNCITAVTHKLTVQLPARRARVQLTYSGHVQLTNMQRRTLIYSILLVILGIAIAVVVILILRKRAAGPEIVIIPSSGSPTMVVVP